MQRTTRRHLLIVDDDADLARFLAEILGSCDQDYLISVARSGEEALEQLHESAVDLLITDLRMSGVDGLALIRWLRAFYPGTPAILMTGDSRKSVAAQARACGAFRTIRKSLDLPSVVERAVRDSLSA
jgi:two-component system response regulator GlrR